MRSMLMPCTFVIVCASAGLGAQTPFETAARGQAVMAQLAAGDFAKVEAQSTDRMKAALPAGRLEGLWARMIGEAGAFQRCAPARVQEMGEMQIVITTCEFARAHVDAQILFDAAGKLAGLQFRPAGSAPAYAPPPYATPSSFAESEITIGEPDWRLPATLAMPQGPGPFPAVVLVHGSGPNDRDETVGANKPFKDLALGLASRGVAVLRYDKRTNVYPTRLAAFSGLTVKEEVVDDAVEAAKALRTQPKIDPS